MEHEKSGTDYCLSAALTYEPMKRGLTQVFTGGGKGKTSAGIGTAVRASGRGYRVYIVYFMNQNYDSGEQEVLHCLPGVKWAAFGPGLVRHPETPTPEVKAKASQALAEARRAMLSGDWDVVIMDEINIVTGWGWLETRDVVQLIKDRPEHVELVMTGRLAPQEVIDAADLVTEMVKIKHPYDRGIPARRGIEY
ncbi:cob(I)yrinic acid a,c-diamide adenosyltransferase [Dehalogenimonas etheniformans]|uniref:Cob(I)yrinic acid a,c-diamide adenosyltransferase n=1 Tax=Dehalogenimonas etheniformans TaxID=1536648 RepID=A0A2P5P613_9CHLR|nr:cob(I)yrinic acid a,c-diamide adenosyltransferase [Dehalogenimonas etheniformans]PPD57743.1 cob(I)yrinic acid a,c-diamide adenosyltransferase [Dehalogenimonas etheniformans]QNT76085.1 cob(I)yrinic acid a,c-diamide adenosyltransferase [Dehalogenimonas etheniformans]